MEMVKVIEQIIIHCIINTVSEVHHICVCFFVVVVVCQFNITSWIEVMDSLPVCQPVHVVV